MKKLIIFLPLLLVIFNNCAEMVIKSRNTQNYPYLEPNMVDNKSALIVLSDFIFLHNIDLDYTYSQGKNERLKFAGLPTYIPKYTGKMDLFFKFRAYRTYSNTSAVASIELKPQDVFVICDNKNEKSWNPTIGLLIYNADTLAKKWKTDLLEDSKNFCSQKEKYQTNIKQALILSPKDDKVIKDLQFQNSQKSKESNP